MVREALTFIRAKRQATKSELSRNPLLKLHLVERNGLLYTKFQSRLRVVEQLVVPRPLRSRVLFEAHDSPLSGHLGMKKTMHHIQERYFWPGLTRDVAKYIRSCHTCLTTKANSRAEQAPIQPTATPFYPFQYVSTDVLGPFPESNHRNKYVVLFIDWMTRWIVARAIPNQEAVTISQVLIEDVITKFGIPEKLLSDQGRNFESNLFKHTCSQLGIHKIRTSSYHPAHNGLIERQNRTLLSILRSVIDPDQKNWDEQLQASVFAMNTSTQTTTGHSPYFLLFGREARIPLDLLTNTPPPCDPAQSPTQRAQNVRNELQIEWAEVRSRLMKAQTKRQTYHRQRHSSFHPFAVGDLVLKLDKRRRKGRNPKLSPKWVGPYKVLQRIGQVNYQILREGGKKKEIVNHNNLRHFIDRPDDLHFNNDDEFDHPNVETHENDNAEHVEDELDDDDDDPPWVPAQGNTPIGNYKELRRSQRTRRPPDFYLPA